VISSAHSPNDLSRDFRPYDRFSLWLALAFTTVVCLPALVGFFTVGESQTYLGNQLNVDDHMVYAAWMRQAMEGNFFFDNRFTTDEQPHLTVHFYFLVLGWFARFVGISGAMLLGRAASTFVFVWLLSRLIREFDLSVFVSKLSLTLAIIGGGLGFLVWHNFGIALTKPTPGFLSQFLQARLPVDVWQPEAFVFPSALANGLFMASLCLMVGIYLALLKAQTGWCSVWWGFLCALLLMNIHSYDMVIVGTVLLAFACSVVFTKLPPWPWVGRSFLILCGAVAPALWLGHVLRNDPVFAARAATETFSPGFRHVFFALLPAIALATGAFLKMSPIRTRTWGLALAIIGIILLIAFSADFRDGFWMSWPVWILSIVLASVIAYLLAPSQRPLALTVSWAFVGLMTIYMPTLFQRKLAMGIGIPWLILAGIGLALWIEPLERPRRNLIATLALLVLGATSLRWFQRELLLIRENVSSTTVHPVSLGNDARQIIKHLNESGGRKVVLAAPGMPRAKSSPDEFTTPYLPDLNPILTGLSGAYTYAGHWSETPDYARRRSELLMRLFLNVSNSEDKSTFLNLIGATHIVAPNVNAYPEYQVTMPDGSAAKLAELSQFGSLVYSGPQFSLIELPKN